jgi:hypothetical protein
MGEQGLRLTISFLIKLAFLLRSTLQGGLVWGVFSRIEAGHLNCSEYRSASLISPG